MILNKKIYISGKITGATAKELTLFNKAEKKLLALGFEVVNPMNLPHEHDEKWISYMREDIKALLDCDHIYMLENWASSRGAFIEHHLAIMLSMNVIYDKSETTNYKQLGIFDNHVKYINQKHK